MDTAEGQIDSLNYSVCWNWLEFIETAIKYSLISFFFDFIVFSSYLTGGQPQND